MQLFPADPNENLLPFNGVVNYHGPIVSATEADHYLHTLLADPLWENDQLKLFGKHIVTARKIIWYGDSEYAYTYSGSTKHATVWSKPMLELKRRVEQASQTKFNSCLLNLYHTGEEGMSWHSDDESSLGENTSIACLSFGAERKISFKHKTKSNKMEVELEHGSLLVMKGTTQSHWLHSIPKTKKISQPRISLTFRTIIQQSN